MSSNSIDYQELLHIVELLKSSEHLTEFRLKVGDLELEVRRDGAGTAGARAPAIATVPTPAPAPAPAQPAMLPPSAASADGSNWSERAVRITSPMVGTFYCAPEPGAAPFVQRGQQVEPDTTVCIVEVMKLMNTIGAGCRGKVVDILVADGQPVEYGQLIMVIEPH